MGNSTRGILMLSWLERVTRWRQWTGAWIAARPGFNGRSKQARRMEQDRRRTRRAVVGQERRNAGSLFLQSGAGRANGACRWRADGGWMGECDWDAAGANAHARSRHEPKPASASPPAHPRLLLLLLLLQLHSTRYMLHTSTQACAYLQSTIEQEQ